MRYSLRIPCILDHAYPLLRSRRGRRPCRVSAAVAATVSAIADRLCSSSPSSCRTRNARAAGGVEHDVALRHAGENLDGIVVLHARLHLDQRSADRLACRCSRPRRATPSPPRRPWSARCRPPVRPAARQSRRARAAGSVSPLGGRFSRVARRTGRRAVRRGHAAEIRVIRRGHARKHPAWLTACPSLVFHHQVRRRRQWSSAPRPAHTACRPPRRP